MSEQMFLIFERINSIGNFEGDLLVDFVREVSYAFSNAAL